VNIVNAGNEVLEIKQGALLGQLSEIETAEGKFEDAIVNFIPLDFNEIKNLAKERHQKYINWPATSTNSKTNQSRPLSGRNFEKELTTEDLVEHETYLKLKAMKYGDLLTADEKEIMLETVMRKAEVFNLDQQKKLGRTNLTVHSVPTGDHPPIQQKQYPIPSIAREPLANQVKEMLDAKVIGPSTSSWRSPILLVKKKSLDGSVKYRFCIDLKKVNAITAKDCYSLPLIGQTVDALIGCSYFTTLDLDRAFWQVPVAECDKSKLAFVLDGKLFKFNVMPFGSMNAPATFQRLVDRVLRGLTWKQCLVYIDDILIFSKTFEQHCVDVDEVLHRFAHANLLVKPDKCSFGESEVEYLGFKITKEGIQVTAKKIEAVQRVLPPETIKTLYSFLCSMNYYRMLIPNFGKLTYELYKMTQTKASRCVWSEHTLKCFNVLKQALISAPILAFPDNTKAFIIQTDASGVAIGAVLLQKHGVFKPVAFCSRKLNATEQRYSATERELLAIVYAVHQFKLHVEGRHLTIYTDHEPLVTMKELKNPMGRLGRLFHDLAEEDYSLRHIAGNENFLPDFLSRVASVDCIQLQTDLTEFNSVIDWVTEQNKDAEIVCIKQLLSKGEQPWSEEQVSSRWSRERKRLYVFNDILYNENRIVVPSHMIKTVLFQHHDTVFAGHRGAETTLESLKTRFYWNFMPADVTAYCSSCEKCQIFNYSQLINRAPLKSIVTVRPWQIVGLDYMGPFKRTTRGNIYVIIGVDHFTKFVTGAATATFSAEVTADFLFREIVCKFGMLEKLLSDQGSNFEAQTFKHLCVLIGTDKIRTTTYHARGNGITERVNKNVKPYLAKFVNTNHDDWDQFMPLVINAYNNSFHSTIGMTLNNQLPSGTVTNDISEFVLRLRRASENLNKIISENTAAAQIQQKESYDRFVQNKTQFRIGDSVKITNFSKPIGSVSAFVPKFLGP